MREQKNLQIAPMEIEDVIEIDKWQSQFEKTKEFESIQKYIAYENEVQSDFLPSSDKSVAGTQISSLTDIIDEYYITKTSQQDYDPMEEDFLAYVMKNEENKIVLFSIINFRDLLSHHNPAIIESIVVHPQYQNKGYATKFLTELFGDQNRFFGWKPNEFITSFSRENKAAKKLFAKFGFNFKESENFISAQTYEPKLTQESEPGANQ